VSRRLYTHKSVRYSYSYDIDDVCSLFSNTGLHPQTVRAWIKNGLKTVDSGRPILIYGDDLISYLKTQNSKNKCKTEFDEFFCMKCKDARNIFRNKIVIEHKNNFLKANGYCRECKTSMYKSYKMEDFPQLRKNFSLVDVLELYDCVSNTDKTHLHAHKESNTNESLQGNLF